MYKKNIFNIGMYYCTLLNYILKNEKKKINNHAASDTVNG